MRSATGRVSDAVVSAYLLARGILYLGRRHICPCCGWRVRAFTAGGGSLRRRETGYCPRCNAKARHRRVRLFLQDTGLLDNPIAVLHVAPHRSLGRALRRVRTISYHSIDIVSRPGVETLATATALPFGPATFDGVVTVHVLEHLDDDQAAMREMERVVRQDGWVLVNVPCMWEEPTLEVAGITSPAERRRLFGEDDHRRRYGRDLTERLAAAGFDVSVDLAGDLPESTAVRFGLNREEHVFLCRPARGRP